jgi:small subunit ribosomal protein S6
MRKYEAMVIVDARLEEADIQRAVERFTGVVADSGGKVANIDRWGTRRFAYEINHQNEGYYFVATFEAPEDAVEKLTRVLQISDEYVRGKIVRPAQPGPETKEKHHGIR